MAKPSSRDYQQEEKNFLANGGRAKQSERQRARRAFDAANGKAARAGKALDHKVPIKKGGKSTPSNIRLTNFSANSARNFKSPKSGK